MGSAFTGWRFLVNFLLPPPMLLTFLLVMPFPRQVRKGLLIFTNEVLSFSVLGGLKFVHLALVLSGVPLVDSGFRTYKIQTETANPELTPNQRMGVLARKWREERNFWIAAMAFTLWCLLTVLYSQVNHAMKIHDRLDEVTEELNELKGIKPPTPTSNRARMAGGLNTMATSLGLNKPKAAAGEESAPAGTSRFGGLGGLFGKGKGKEKDEAGSAETELSCGVGDSTNTSMRRRAAAATAEVSM